MRRRLFLQAATTAGLLGMVPAAWARKPSRARRVLISEEVGMRSTLVVAGAPTATGGALSRGPADSLALTDGVAVTNGPPSALTWGWQVTASNVGLSGAGIDRTTLPTYTGGTPTAGQTITLKKITAAWDLGGWNGGGDNGVQVPNVTFDRCWFSVPADRCGAFGPNTQFLDCDIVGPGTAPNAYGPLVSENVATAAVFTRCYIDNFTIALWLDGAATVDRCFITGSTTDPNVHVDGITRRGSNRPLTITRSNVRAKGISVTGALFVTADFLLNPAGVVVSDSLFDSDGDNCLVIGNNSPGGTSSYSFSNVRGLGNNIVARDGAGTATSNPFTVWRYNTADPLNPTDGGRKGASVPF